MKDSKQLLIQISNIYFVFYIYVRNHDKCIKIGITSLNLYKALRGRYCNFIEKKGLEQLRNFGTFSQPELERESQSLTSEPTVLTTQYTQFASSGNVLSGWELVEVVISKYLD